MSKKLRNALLIPLAALFVGCASNEAPRENIVDHIESEKAPYNGKPQSVREREAYEAGVKDVLIDMKGKMRARDRFTWEEPIVDCGVQIPARVANGMLIPSHNSCVQIAPGRWIEESPTYLPELGLDQ